MKKTIVLLLVFAAVAALVGCVAKSEGKVMSGIYHSKTDSTGPYVFFDAENMTWATGAGIAFDYSIGGQFEINGDLLIAKCRVEDTDCEIEFRILSDFGIRATSLKMPDWFNWIGKDDEFMYVSDFFFDTVCSADEGLAIAKAEGAVITESGKVTGNREIWDDFFEASSAGRPSSVNVAVYYPLQENNQSENRDEYPKLYFYYVTYYDGEFTIVVRPSTEREWDYTSTFKYLKHMTGETDLPNSPKHRFDCYVLVDDPDADWNEIVRGMFSSYSHAGYRHITIIDEYFD